MEEEGGCGNGKRTWKKVMIQKRRELSHGNRVNDSMRMRRD